MTCRYRFILMGANTKRDTPVVSLMELNDSIRVLSPLYRLSSKQRLYHNSRRKNKPSLRTSAIYDSVFALIILQSVINYSPHTFQNVVLSCQSSVCMLKTWLICTWKSKGTESQGKCVLQSQGHRLKTITVLLNGWPLFCVDALFSPCHLLYQDTSGDTHSPLVFPQGAV